MRYHGRPMTDTEIAQHERSKGERLMEILKSHPDHFESGWMSGIECLCGWCVEQNEVGGQLRRLRDEHPQYAHLAFDSPKIDHYNRALKYIDQFGYEIAYIDKRVYSSGGDRWELVVKRRRNNMSETPRRYSAEEIRALMAGLRHLRGEFQRIAEGEGDEHIGKDAALRRSDLSLLAEIDLSLSQAAEDASRLEQIEKWVSVQMSEGELRGYLPDLRKFLSSSAGRREAT